MNTIIYCIWRGDITFKNDPFNEIDNLLLSQISYISFGDLFAPGDKKTIKELAQLCLDNIDIFRKGSRLFSDSIPALKAMVNTCDGEYNIQAQLLSDNSHYPLRVSIFDGETKASNLFAVREFGFNCLLYSLDELLRYGDVLNIIQADEEKRIVERKEVPLFDNRAFNEAIINAVLHNKWVDGNEPMITVYSDRIEILSRGVLPPKQTLDGFFSGQSIPVNEKLSEIFLQLRISEKSGRGVPKIVDTYGKEAFEFRDNAIVVTIPFNWINKVGNNVGNKVGNKKSSLTDNRRMMLKEMRHNPNITKKQLQKVLNISSTAVDNNIAYLRNHGYIERVGSNKTGYWKVND